MLETNSHVYYPSTLNEMLNLKTQHPEAVLWAGGTGFMGRQHAKRPVLPANIIQISRISELTKIRRTERFLEIGTGVVINKILNVGQHVLPHALAEAMRSIKPSVIRNAATIGGHICTPDVRLNLFSVLMLMDVSAELRHSGGTRWLQLNRLFNRAGEIQIKENEVLTRIRIPFGNWNRQVFKSDGNPFHNTGESISFCILADVQKGILSDFRLIIGNTGRMTVRSIELEALLIGRKLPLSQRDSMSVLQMNREWLDSMNTVLTAFQKNRAHRFLVWILTELMP